MVDARVLSPSMLLTFSSTSFFSLAVFLYFFLFLFASTNRLNSFMSFAEVGGGKHVSTLTKEHYQ